MSDDPNQGAEVEFSLLCQFLTREGVTVEVAIYRVPEVDARWLLKVIDENETSTVWDGLFETDDEAFEAFEEALEAEGVGGMTETVH